MAKATFRIATCLSCGSKRIKLLRRLWKDSFEGKVYTVPDLEFYECPDCGERIYDREAMRKIEAHSPAFLKFHRSQKSA